MSIRFNIQDYRIKEIRDKSGLDSAHTALSYIVYGLKNDGNYPVIISVPTALATAEGIKGIVDSIAKLFASNNLDVKVQFRDLPNHPATIGIGLRKDLRDSMDFTAGVLQTIVYALEGRLKVVGGYKIPGVPSVPGFVPLPKYISQNYKGENVVWEWDQKIWARCDAEGNLI